MNDIPYNSVDIIVTSPPYNIGVNYSGYDDNRNDYWEWSKEWVQKLESILKPNGSFFLNLGSKPSNAAFPMEFIVSVARECFDVQNAIHWIKSISVNGESYGHFKPINSKRYLNDCHEYVFHLTKKKETELNRLAIGVPFKDKSNIKRWKSNKEDKRCGGNVWFIPYDTVQATKFHPATFPLELPLRCIKLHGYDKNTVVLDPFVGCGTTSVACRQLGIKNFIGIDISEKYIKYCENE